MIFGAHGVKDVGKRQFSPIDDVAETYGIMCGSYIFMFEGEAA